MPTSATAAARRKAENASRRAGALAARAAAGLLSPTEAGRILLIDAPADSGRPARWVRFLERKGLLTPVTAASREGDEGDRRARSPRRYRAEEVEQLRAWLAEHTVLVGRARYIIEDGKAL